MVQMFDLYLNQQTWISFVFICVACVSNIVCVSSAPQLFLSTLTEINQTFTYLFTGQDSVKLLFSISFLFSITLISMTGTPVIHNLWLTAQRSTQYISSVCGYWSCASFLFIVFVTWISGVPHSQTLIFNVAQGKCTSLIRNSLKTIQHSLVLLLIRWFDLSTTLFIDTTEICYFLCMYFTVNDCNFINVSINLDE